MKKLLLAVFLLIFPAVALSAPADELSGLSLKVKEAAFQGHLGEIAQAAPELLRLRTELGYRNLSSLSESLISSASVDCFKQQEGCKFLVHYAIEFSPTDPWIRFHAAVLSETSMQRISLLFAALRYSLNSPTFFYKACVFVGLITLVILTLILALKLLFRIIRFELNGAILKPNNFLPLFILMFGGLPFGVLPSLLCWSILTLVLMRDRKCLIHLLLLSVSWLLFLPIAENILLYVNNPEERELELLLAKTRAPSSGIAVASEDPAYLATKAYEVGRYAEAKELFAAAAQVKPDFQSALIARQVASAIQLKQYPEAQEVLTNARAAGLDSYESYQNEALIAVGLADLNRSREILEKLRNWESQKLPGEIASAVVLLEPLPLAYFGGRYLGAAAPSAVSAVNTEARWVSNPKVLLALCSFGVSGILFVLSIAIVLFGASNTRAFSERFSI